MTQAVVESPENQIQEKQTGKVVLRVEGLYKKFCRNLKRSMIYGMTDLAKGFVGVKPKTEELRKDEFWALQDINFELRKGETLGVIGVNGAGKSTLLRILSGIFPPDKGRVSIEGTVGSLIALGAGMHPHLTGRENIYLNGAVLGLSKKEIDAKFDEIISFAEIGDFLDAPFSTYSSGMRVRLGFSVAINIKPDILLVDEVLSVGDINFRRKSLEKLEALRRETATIFISHSMRHVSRICDKVLWIENSKVKLYGSTEDVVSQYVNQHESSQEDLNDIKVITSGGFIRDYQVAFSGADNTFTYGEDVELQLKFHSDEEVDASMFVFSLFSRDETLVSVMNNQYDLKKISIGINEIKFRLPKTKLVPGYYHFKVKTQLKFGGVVFEIDTPAFKINEWSKNLLPQSGLTREEYELEVNS
ncbi:ABC transporter ATP-binding protein [bacterium]|nr:MAG: ABC transporter ATP-binding protein [bacterium]